MNAFLTAETMLMDSDLLGPEKVAQYAALLEVTGARPLMKGAEFIRISVPVGDWVRIGVVHDWLAERLPNADSGAECLVSRHNLSDLREYCDERKDTESRRTVAIINHVLSNVPDDWDIYYRVSV